MIRTRVFSAVLTGALLMTVAACGGDDAASTAGDAAAPATAAPAETTAAAAPADDKALCEQAGAASEQMRTEFVKLLTGSLEAGAEPKPEDFKKILVGMEESLTKAVGTADSEVAVAMKEVAAQSAKAAASADPSTAAEDPAFEKSGVALDAACKKVGVEVNFA
ncbi:hypothetical protein AB0F81_19800 [Actinoplanes sp. NPDC024001]|uniref:hypothetical protein n=1 Tax=Actinoplanes sp. NPDC024001 TaxID=3154598 RepID=UPI0033F1F9A2